uniref:Ovule protein n=1 Tax=Caenorhabditis tropicalis TaxID=1561998 RepID=A0A1I7U990_9PELO
MRLRVFSFTVYDNCLRILIDTPLSITLNHLYLGLLCSYLLKDPWKCIACLIALSDDSPMITTIQFVGARQNSVGIL